MDELIKGVKIGKLIQKDKQNETCKIFGIVLAVIATIVAIAGVAYAIHSFINRDYYDDFEDDYDDIFDEDESDFED